MKQWFYQDKVNQLGNFVMATPLLVVLHKIYKKPIPIYFATKAIEELYSGSGILNILKSKPKNPTWSTAPPKQRKSTESDTDCWIRIHTGKTGQKIEKPHTFVPLVKTKEILKKEDKKHIAIFHGCFAKKHQDNKTLPIETLNYMIESVLRFGYIPVVLGNNEDYNNFWKNVRNIRDSSVVNYLGKLSLVDSVAMLQQCDAFMSNDTGLYHVAGASNMKGLVMWYRTNHIKNMSPAKTITHVLNNNRDIEKYNKSIDRFLENI